MVLPPANKVLQVSIAHLLKRPVGKPPKDLRRYHAHAGRRQDGCVWKTAQRSDSPASAANWTFVTWNPHDDPLQ